MSRGEVTDPRYAREEIAVFSQAAPEVSAAGNPETKEAPVRRCTTCGRRGHRRDSPAFHPNLRRHAATPRVQP